MTTSIRWWTSCAFGRTPLASKSDRMQARALMFSLLLVVVAAFPAVLAGEQAHASRLAAIATEAKTVHPVEATALGNSTAAPTAIQSSTTFLTPVRWTARDGVHEATTEVETPVKAGGKVQIWLDAQGKITRAPATGADATVDSLGVAALAWLVMAALIGAVMATVRAVLRRAKDREWDRGLRELAGYGGGSTTRAN
jgi:hypothetical protein